MPSKNTTQLETSVEVANQNENWTLFEVTVTNTLSTPLDAEDCTLEVTADAAIIQDFKSAWVELDMEVYAATAGTTLTITLEAEEDPVIIAPGDSFVIGFDFDQGDLTEEDLTCTATADQGAGESPVPDTPSTRGALFVGTDGRLKGEDGDDILLLGMSSHGYTWYGEFLNPHSMEQIPSVFSGNLVRVAMYTATEDDTGYLDFAPTGQANLREEIKTRVQEAIDADLYVIIDWHLLYDFTYGVQPFPSRDFSGTVEMDPEEWKAHAIGFFEEMARTFGESPNVLFEIFNEPNYSTPDNSSGAPLYTWEDMKGTAEEIIDAIRETGAQNVILVGTPEWCQRLDQVVDSPIEDRENIMYNLHFYAKEHLPEPGQHVFNMFQTAMDDALPVFVTEFGTTMADGGQGVGKAETEGWLSALNDNNVSYANWSLSNKDEDSAALATSAEPDTWGAGDLSPSGGTIAELYAARPSGGVIKRAV
ncbi:glycoside hydrolase family 5 protein [Desulfoluna butyratoxydans]|uniref:Glycoside hydrolase superfamily n=1 Tax=Desulfoluna butyratoxydans TaxID=231438 RepID=A0A4U8YQJ0_9BACT|nr:glycoside hydrolase family 5 protein [Desulfoluna butyratoxydans]VFQ46516.1 glycoside hydrolase superfamily [Desulfoluna butyratoxydans]